MDEVRQELRTKLFDVAKKKAALVKDMQKLVRKVIRDNTQQTKAALTKLQAGANLAALEMLVSTHDQEYARAQEEYEMSESKRFISLCLLIESGFLVSREFFQVKDVTKKKLNISKAKLSTVTDEMRSHFEQLANVRYEIFRCTRTSKRTCF